MATAPVYFVTPRLLTGLVPATQDTSFTAPTHVTTLGSGGANGTKISELIIIPVATVVAGVVNVFAYDGSTYHLLPGASVTVAAATVSTTAAPVVIADITFDNLVLPSSSWSLVCSNTVAGNVSLIEVVAYGADA